MPLGEHLGAHQQRGLTPVDLRQLCLQARGAAGCVSVDPDNTSVGKQAGKGLLRALGTGANRNQGA